MNNRFSSIEPNGFTLIELIIVVALLAIITAGVVPIFNGTFRTVQGDHTVRDLAATFRFAQERAVTDALEYRILINPGKNTYGLERLKEIDGKDKVYEPVKVLNQEVVQLPSQFKIKATRAKKDGGARSGAYVAFYPNGACDDAKIDLVGPDGKTSSIETSGGVGRLKVKE